VEEEDFFVVVGCFLILFIVEAIKIFLDISVNKWEKKGLESVRVNQQYRIEFSTRSEGAQSDVITVCAIHELSNHYK
jgi:proteic killer suppression protein